MADRTRRNELAEGERPSVAVPPPVTSVVPAAHVPPAASTSRDTALHRTSVADASDASGADAPADPPTSGRYGGPLGLSLAIGGGGAVLALAARVLTTSVAGQLPYDAPSTMYTVVVSLLASAVAVVLTAWAEPSKEATSADRLRYPNASFAALPIAAATIWLGFTIQGARDDARAYDDAEREVVSTSVLEHRAAEREAHAMTQFALGAAYYRDRRFAEAESRLAYAFELDPRNIRAAELRRHAIAAMVAQSHPAWRDPNANLTADSVATTLKIARYYASLLAAGDHSPPIYEGILSGLRLEKRYDDAIAIAEMYLSEHPGDPIWVGRVAELREASRRDPAAVHAPLRSPVRYKADLATMRRMVPNQPPDPWTEASFAYEYLKAALADPTAGRDSLLAAADGHTRRAIELAPQSAPYRVQLALVRFISGDYAGCDSAFADAMRLDPHILDRHPENAAFWRIAKARIARLPANAGGTFILTPPPRP